MKPQTIVFALAFVAASLAARALTVNEFTSGSDTNWNVAANWRARSDLSRQFQTDIMTRKERQKQANEIRQGIENDVEDLL